MEAAPASTSKDHLVGPYHGECPGACGGNNGNATSSLGSSTSASKRHRPGKLIDAEGWFAENNQNVRSSQPQLFIDDDPPFYIGSNSSSKYLNVGSSDASRGRPHHRRRKYRTMSNGSEAMPAKSFDCNCDEFRSVIDDLTIENRKLKRRLKKYGRTQPSPPEGDRLFEFRSYGLSAQQKGRLEETLRLFALDCAESSEETCHELVPQGQLQQQEKLPCHKTSSTSTCCSRPIDSAYASMTASGQNSTVQSAHTRPYPWRSEQPVKSKHEDIQSYLHDIPQEVQTNNSPSMSDSAKKELVVKRLEALFTGRRATATEHSQPAQQQEVSHLAAIADRKGAEARGNRPDREGVREARILPAGTGSASELSNGEQTSGLQKPHFNHDYECRSITPGAMSSSSNGIPDQRPTRPLDLDLQRAQIAAENVEYIRHLGLSSPKLDLDLTPQESDGWVYLNLLTNMAQLHTLNVTVEFIRKAVSDISARLELSGDGRKIRWLGGTEGTQINSESESCLGKYDESVAELGNNTGEIANKRRKLSHCRALNIAAPMLSSVFEGGSYSARKEGSSNLLNYKPLFIHGTQCSENDDDHSQDSDSSVSFGIQDHPTHDHPVVPPMPRCEASSLPAKRKQKSGPIIFYRNADFCTDLSGDSLHSMDDRPRYGPQIDNPCELALKPVASVGHHWASDDEVSRQQSSLWYTGDSASYYKETEGALMDFEPLPLCGGMVPSDMCSPVSLEASGVGGVQPKDNFVINVQVRHNTAARSSSSTVSYLSTTKRPPLIRLRSHTGKDYNDLLGCITSGQSQRVSNRENANPVDNELSHPQWAAEECIRYDVVSVARTELLPSKLPPPSYVYFPASSSGECDSLATDDGAAASTDSRFQITGSAQKVVLPLSRLASIGHSPNSDGEAADSDSDASMDLLAAARALDPDAIAAYEREFDGNMGSIYTEEAYMASSAATFGAGSRFSDNESSCPTD
ncbi:MAG: hypothetical protein M1812_004730 [Candelaria pacifica]|nr:MAG: hypothetical protein M1812_004730 [Candelaria pacifica]